jgi:hypothetical protein
LQRERRLAATASQHHDGGPTRPLQPRRGKVWVQHDNRVESVDLGTGARETILELGVSQGAGMTNVTAITVADDPRAYAYTSAEYSSRLFQIDGVK